MRCWFFEETEKKMYPMKDEWALVGTPPEPFHFDFMGWQETTILKLTEYPSNPLEEMKEALMSFIVFIPEGWPMPLGWNQIVQNAKKAMEGK